MTVVVVQARMGSTRLPGKSLKPLAGKTVLAHVLERCLAIENATGVCCALPDGTENDVLETEARRIGASVYRGPETDVLARYLGAARAMSASAVLRVTGDCPLIDPYVCAEVIRLRKKTGAAYASNNQPPSFPHGLDCEAIRIDWLERAQQEAHDPYDREHVTPYIRRHPEADKASLCAPEEGLAHHRWTLDTEADLRFLEALFRLLPTGPAAWSYRSVVQVLARHPEVVAINARETTPARETASWG